MSQPMLWQALTWEDVAALRERGITMAILPVGATEQHGPHLPLGVDTLSAEAVAHGASALTGIPVLPNLVHQDRWLLWLGILFVVSVYAFPGGIVGRLRRS